jgi:hypothetical protein
MPENNQILSVEGQLIGMPTAGPESFSAQQLDYLKRALGVDETVLWEDADGQAFGNNKAFNTSESPLNFSEIRIYWRPYTTHCERYQSFDPKDATDGVTLCSPYKGGGNILRFPYCQITISSSGLQCKGTEYGVLSIEVSKVTSSTASSKIYKITGVCRISEES